MNHLPKILLVIATLFILQPQLTQAQTINMGSNPIRFGTGCYKPLIQSKGVNDFKLAIGYFQGCFGPTYTQETIVINTATGRIGMGTNNPAYRLHLTQNSAAKPGSAYWTVISDKRFKQDIAGFTDGLDLIRKMNPVSFRYKEGSGMSSDEEYVGVIAQELQEIAPYMVKPLQGEDGPTDYLTVDLHALDFALVNSVQELDAQVTTLQEENAKLKARLDRLEDLLVQHRGKLGPETSQQEMGWGIGALTPNPGQDAVRIHYSLPAHATRAEVMVRNSSGAEVASQLLRTQQTESELDLSQLPAGTYLVQLHVDGQASPAKRLVIAR